MKAQIEVPSGGLDLLRSAVRDLQEAEIPRPRWEAEQLLARRLGCEPVALYLEPPPMDPEQAVGFKTGVAARAGGVPLQYLLGDTEFYGRKFFVGPGVFIPRPETEVLVETALGLWSFPRKRESDPRFRGNDEAFGAPLVIDVGTGCGAIAVTLALEHPELRVSAIDRSCVALSFARRNAWHHQAGVSFFQGDLLESITPAAADLIVANLPYLDPERSSAWPRELHWEPWLALDGGEAGLSVIQDLIRQAGSVLKPDGRLILEIGENQAEPVSHFSRAAGFKSERVVKDLAGLDRVVILWRS